MRLVLTFLLLAAPGISNAGSVFLNGANIDGVRNQVFKNCNVTIDKFGNLHIEAKGYAVRGSAGGAAPKMDAAAVGKKPTRRYFLVTSKGAPGMSQYDIDMYVNNKWVRKFLSQEEHVVMELTKYLKTGPNKIRLISKKQLGSAGRRSSSPAHFFRIVIGEGDEGGRNVMITRKAVDYKRTAAETKDFTDSFTVTVY